MNRSSTMASCALVLGSSLAMAQKKAPIPEDSKFIESIQGPDLFRAYCGSCHAEIFVRSAGADLSDEAAGPFPLPSAPRNGGKFPFLKVQEIIAGQAPVVVSHGNREMPVWGPIFSQVTTDQDFGTLRVYNLAKFLETLQK